MSLPFQSPLAVLRQQQVLQTIQSHLDRIRTVDEALEFIAGVREALDEAEEQIRTLAEKVG